jgi:hypothetical protein
VSTSNEIKLWKQGGEDSPDPVNGYLLMDSNTIIYYGRLVWSRIDTGYATDSTYALAHPQNVRCWGKALATVDNTTTNTQGNPGTAGVVPIPFGMGIYLCYNDGSITAPNLNEPVYLVSDQASSNSSEVTVGVAPNGTGIIRPLVGFIMPPTIYPNVNPDALRIPVRVGQFSGVGPVPGVALQSYTNDATVYTASFSVVPGCMHKINVSGAAFTYTFPAITQAIDGMKIAVVNVGAGTTATVAAPTGSDNVGNYTTGTGATAAGPTTAAVKVYTADNTQKAWLVGI